MVVKPTLPDGYGLPETVGEWTHDPESNKNGHAWYGPDGQCAVAVYNSVGRVYARVSDERVSGFARGRELWECDVDDVPRADQPPLVADAIEHAVAWMQQHAPPWRHPAVVEAALTPPPGYVLERCIEF